MPYNKRELARLGKARRTKQVKSETRLCYICRVNEVHQPGQFKKPCEPCYCHMRFDTAFRNEKCFWCQEAAREFWIDHVTCLWKPYCGVCRHVHQWEHPEQWEAWPWHEAREALWRPRGARERLAVSPYTFVLLAPFQLLDHGWRARIVPRTDHITIVETIELPPAAGYKADHFVLWHRVNDWIHAQ